MSGLTWTAGEIKAFEIPLSLRGLYSYYRWTCANTAPNGLSGNEIEPLAAIHGWACCRRLVYANGNCPMEPDNAERGDAANCVQCHVSLGTLHRSVLGIW